MVKTRRLMSYIRHVRGQSLFGSVPAAWSPLSLGGIAAWWDFSDASKLYQDAARTVPVAADGDVLGGLADKYGSNMGSQSVTAKKPTYRTAVQNSRSVSRWDGVDDCMAVSVASIVSAFVVYRRTGVNVTGYHNLIYGPNGWQYPAIGESSAQNKWYLGGGWRSGAAAPDTNWHCNLYVLTGTGAKVYLDGVLDLSYTGALTGGGITCLGSWDGSQRYANADIGEIVLSTADVSADVATAQAYFAQKWGL